jgi:hypothetical protein
LLPCSSLSRLRTSSMVSPMIKDWWAAMCCKGCLL